MLGMTQATLAEAAGISTTALNNIERGSADPKASTLGSIRRALETAGVIFVEENGEGPGVRLKKVRQENQSPRTIPLENLSAENDE